jgi:hypothetical protein
MKNFGTSRWMTFATVATFFVQGFLFASWTAHIPHVKGQLHLGDSPLGLALLGAPVGSMLAMLLAGFVLGPPLIGAIATVTSLRTALFQLPLLATVVITTATSKSLRSD